MLICLWVCDIVLILLTLLSTYLMFLYANTDDDELDLNTLMGLSLYEYLASLEEYGGSYESN